MVQRSKLDLRGYATISENIQGDFIIQLEGYNTKGKDVSVQVTLSSWQFNDMIEKVAKLHVKRIEREQRDFEDFKNSVKI